MALWDAFLDDTFIQGTLEVLVAASTDAELRDAALVADAVVFDAVTSIAKQIEHPTASDGELAEILTMSMHYFRGVALD